MKSSDRAIPGRGPRQHRGPEVRTCLHLCKTMTRSVARIQGMNGRRRGPDGAGFYQSWEGVRSFVVMVSHDRQVLCKGVFSLLKRLL